MRFSKTDTSASLGLKFQPFPTAQSEQSVASCFESVVERFPNQLAIESLTERLTYAELNQRANRIARAIVAIRGTREEPIALLLEQGATFIASMLAVLKAGKSYAPLDPAFPEQRTVDILADTEAPILITSNENLEYAQKLASVNCTVLNTDDLDPDLSADNLDLPISPDAPAYIIYTSGSTGKPKGVLQNQRNLLHNCMNQTNAFRMRVGDRMTLLHSCSVMGAVRVIYNALLNGVTLYPFDVKAEGLTALRDLLIQKEITVYHSVATLFRHLASILPPDYRFPDMRLVILGGEAATRKDFELYQQHFTDDCELATGLGATETGTVCVNLLTKISPVSKSLLPPGYPVASMEVLLLDEHDQEVPTGEVGEIVIRSPYLAKGYWKRPDLTAAAFSEVSERGGIYQYRMGDLGRMEPDGCLVHMGRKDFQVKIRGYRVELSEIEVTILDTGVIKEAVVVGCKNTRKDHHQDIEDELFLAAYYVPKAGNSVASETLRNYIAKKLPSYMIPAVFVPLEALPLTANGKIDRRSLPAPDQIRKAPVSFVAPRDNWERQLVTIWEGILGVKSIGVKNNFFDLGGHSLLAARLFAEIKETFDQDLPLAALFQAPTIEELANFLRQASQSESAECSLIPLHPDGSKPPLFLVPPAGTTVVNLGRLVRHLKPDQPVYGLEPLGMDGKQFPHTDLKEMAAHYIQEIQKLQPQGPYFIAGRCFGGVVVFEMAQQLWKQGQTVALLGILDTQTPPNFASSTKSVPHALAASNDRKSQGGLLNGFFFGQLFQRLLVRWRRGRFLPTRVLQSRLVALCIWILNGAESGNSMYLFLQKELFSRIPRIFTLAAHRRSRIKYWAKVYPGVITFFKNSDESMLRITSRWAELTAQKLDCQTVPGNHRTMLMKSEHAKAVAENLSACLDKAQSETANLAQRS